MAQKKVRRSLYVSKDIDDFVKASCVRILIVRGKTMRMERTLNEAYIDLIKRGIFSLQDDDQEENQEAEI